MSYIIPVAIVLSIIQKILDKKIRKKLVYGGSISDTNGYRYYMWTMIIMLIPIVFCVFYFVTTIHPVVGVLLTLLFLIRSMFEWKYIKTTNRHIVSLLMALISFFLTVIFYVIWK